MGLDNAKLMIKDGRPTVFSGSNDVDPQGLILDSDAVGLAMRSSIAAASASNPVTNEPWTVPPAWAPSTLYPSAAYVTGIGAGNTDNLYHCSLGGISAADTGPVGTSLAEFADNAAKWMYAGKARSVGTYPLFSSVIPAAPTDQMDGYLVLVPTASRAALGLTRRWNFTFQNPIIRFTGGPLVAGFAGTQLEMLGSNSGSAAAPNRSTNARFMAHFQTDARNWIYMASNAGNTPNRKLRIEVNGRGLTEYGFRVNPTAGSALMLDLSKFGPGPKDVRIYGEGPMTEQVFDFYTDPDVAIWKPSPRNALKICFEGDSITQGGGSETAPSSEFIEHVTARLLGIDSWYNNAVGATGGLQTNGGARTSYIQRLPDIASEAPAILVVGGFHNDANVLFPSAARRAGYLEYFRAIRAMLPGCTVFVTGNQVLQNDSLTATGVTEQLSVEQDAKAAFDAWGDANAAFIPFLTDVTPWPSSTAAGWNFCTLQAGIVNGHPVFRYNRVVAHKIAEGIKKHFGAV